jgi:hypothetical protein
MLPLYPSDQISWKKKPDPLAISTTEKDLCSFLDGNNGFFQKLYICPITCPPITPGDDQKQRDKKLKAVDSLIKTRAKNAGSLVAIGKSSTKEVQYFQRTYQCEHSNDNNSRPRNNSSLEHDDVESEADVGNEPDLQNQDATYRESHLVNNTRNGRRKGSGRGGKGLKRRRNKAIRSIKTCPFRFTLKVDSIAFYISLYNGSGNSYHVEHPRFDPEFLSNQKSSLTLEEVEDVMHVNNATVSSAACREFVAAKFDKFLHPSQIRYLNSLQDEGICDEYEGVLDAFNKSDQIRFNVLYSLKESSKDVVITSTKILGEVTEDAALLDGNERECLRPVAESAIEQRKSRGLDDKHQVFHCIAWTHEKVLRYFLLCPEVVTFDVTSHTNKSGFHLLTFSCRTSVDKQVVFCRVWLPDQRRASFRYVFQEALPKILPKHVFVRVCFLICDGDAQQNLELQIAVKQLFPNSIVGGCCFHMFHNGWNRHVCTINWTNSKKPTWVAFVRRIHSWMYSWTRPGYCQTREEYEISKHLLIECLTSKHALKMAGNHEYLISSAIAFIKGYVFPNEGLYLFYLRKSVFNLCVATTSAHEGTNHGLKSHAAAVKATHALNTAAKAMTVQDRSKHAQLDQLVGREFRQKDKSTWSRLRSAPYLLTYAEGLMLHSYRRASLYKVRRVGLTRFQVVYAGDRCDPSFVARYIDGWPSTAAVHEKSDDLPSDALTDVGVEEDQVDDGRDEEDQVDDGGEEEDGLLGDQCYCPLFSRAYTVDLNETCTTCECCHFDRAGYPCPHENACAIAVCEEIGTTFEGFGHDSVKVRWWTDFMYWGYRPAVHDEDKELVKVFHHLANNDVKGPKFRYKIPSSMPIKNPIPALPAKERIKNYSKDVLKNYKADRFDTLLSKTHLPTSSQELEDCLDDPEIIHDLRASSDSHFEHMMNEVHEQEMSSLHEVEATEHGSTYRQALYPLFNELTDLLQQLNVKEVGKEVETVLKKSIDDIHRKIAEENDSTSPTLTSSTGLKRSWTSITSKKYSGPPRVQVAKNSKH